MVEDPPFGDRLQVYLVDPANPIQTLLDQGVDGTPVFELTENGANFQAGTVRFDGTTVDIDLTSLVDLTQGELRFQLLNLDGDTKSLIQVSNLQNTIDEAGVESPVFPMRRTVAPIGGPLDLTPLSSSDDITSQISQLQFDASTGVYKADAQITNNGNPISRQVVLVFENIPEGVTIRNASGQDSEGNFYLNLSPSIGRRGLDRQAISNVVELEIENPNGLQFDWQVKTLVGGPNQPPVFETIEVSDVMPGDVLKLPLAATDPDGDTVTFSLRSEGDLPTGTLGGNNVLEFRPQVDQVGTYTFTVVASDGLLETTQDVTLNVIADTVTTTRISGVIENVEQEPLVGVVIELGDLTAVTDEIGAFTIEALGELPSDTLKIRGEGIVGDDVYPFIAEKLPLVLGHDVYDGVNNVIDRPIYLPALDVANGQTIDPNQTTIVTTPNIPGTAVTVLAGSLLDQEGNPFTGVLSITEVPPSLTPAALPQDHNPDLVLTIQPGEMVFTEPALLTVPNTAGYVPGMYLDLFSINPETGDFDKVGLAQVSEDGALIETIEGGIRTSSWHYVVPFIEALDAINPFDNPRNQDVSCPCTKAETVSVNSEVELHSGALTETHDLVTYQSLGQTRGLSLTYDSLRADSRPIVNVSYEGIDIARMSNIGNVKFVASLTVHDGTFSYDMPGYIGTGLGLRNGDLIWSVPNNATRIDAAMQADIRTLPTGEYGYTISSGLQVRNGGPFTGRRNRTTGTILHINSVGSVFGNGWGLSGLQEIIENNDDSVWIIDGDGSEMRFNRPLTVGEVYQSPPNDYSTFERRPDGSFRRTLKNQTVYQFNQDNQLASVTDRNGNKTRYLYNSQEQLEQIIDPVGLVTQFSYTNNQISQITNPDGRITELRHDAFGNLTQVIDPDNTSRNWEYNKDHHMIAEIDKRGNREEAYYNFAGRVIGGQRKDGAIVNVDPLQTQGLLPIEQTIHPFEAPTVPNFKDPETTYADGNGNVRTVELNKVGQLVSGSDGEGALSTVERNTQNLVEQTTNGRGFTSEYAYDALGNVTEIREQVSSIERGAPLGTFGEEGYSLGNSETLIVEDINGDGILDTAKVNPENKSLDIRFGTAAGGFSDLESVDIGVSAGTIAAMGVNQDGQIDFAITPIDRFDDPTNQVLFLQRQADGSFNISQTYALSHTASVLATDDVNQDGYLDLIVGSDQSEGSILLGQATGGLNAPSVSFQALSPFDSITTGDIDQDGYVDIVFGGHTIFWGDVDGAFSAVSSVSGGNSAQLIDLDNNGQLDIVSVLPERGTGLNVALYESTRTFNAQQTQVGSSYDAFRVANLDDDGHLDLFAFDWNLGTIERLTGNGDGTFRPENRYDVQGYYDSFTLTDLDENGHLDLIASSPTGFSIVSGYSNGQLELATWQTLKEITGSTRDFEFIDLNQDGNLDLITSSAEGIRTYLGSEGGSFTFKETLSSKNIKSFKLEDINGDGQLDLLISEQDLNRNQFTIRPWISNSSTESNFGSSQTFRLNVQPLPPIIADFNDDGLLDALLLLPPSLYNGWSSNLILGQETGVFVKDSRTFSVQNQPSSVATGDFNGDGITDIIAANSGRQSLSIYQGDASGGFSSPLAAHWV